MSEKVKIKLTNDYHKTMEKADRRKVERRCKELGVTLTDSGHSVHIDAPRGKVFGSTSTHGIPYDMIGDDDRGMKPRLCDLWPFIFEDLSLGIEDCPDGEKCDQCGCLAEDEFSCEDCALKATCKVE